MDTHEIMRNLHEGTTTQSNEKVTTTKAAMKTSRLKRDDFHLCEAADVFLLDLKLLHHGLHRIDSAEGLSHVGRPRGPWRGGVTSRCAPTRVEGLRIQIKAAAVLAPARTALI
jgi:hypothetical protein